METVLWLTLGTKPFKDRSLVAGVYVSIKDLSSMDIKSTLSSSSGFCVKIPSIFFVLVIFPVSVITFPNKSNLRGKLFALSHSSRAESSVQRNSNGNQSWCIQLGNGEA